MNEHPVDLRRSAYLRIYTRLNLGMGKAKKQKKAKKIAFFFSSDPCKAHSHDLSKLSSVGGPGPIQANLVKKAPWPLLRSS